VSFKVTKVFHKLQVLSLNRRQWVYGYIYKNNFRVFFFTFLNKTIDSSGHCKKKVELLLFESFFNFFQARMIFNILNKIRNRVFSFKKTLIYHFFNDKAHSYFPIIRLFFFILNTIFLYDLFKQEKKSAINKDDKIKIILEFSIFQSQIRYICTCTLIS
jgi:hypothetical protein